MESKKFGFGRSMPPAFKFDPTDADIVAYYLVPRALNLPNPYASAIIEEDPGSAPPWEFLQRHGDVDHAFFFGPPVDPIHNTGRKNRIVKGGVWIGQKRNGEIVTLLRPGGGEVNIRYNRYDLTFYLARGGRSTGYIMHEYEILSPPLPGTVLTRIKVTEKLKKQLVAAAAAAEQQVPDPEELVPSYEYDAAAAQLMSNGEGFGGAQDGAPYGSGMVENAGYYCPPLRYELPLVEYDNNYGVSIADQPGASYNYHDAPMNGEGYTAAQADAYGGGMVDNAGTYFDPSADYSNYYPEYQQWQHQQDRSNQYEAGDAAVVSAGGEVFSGEHVPCGNSNNGSVVGTETSAHSTILLCGGMVNNAGTYFDPSADYSNYYLEYQQWQHQQDRSNQYEAGDAAVVSACGEHAPCGNSDNGSVVGTKTSAHSTILLCGDGELDLDMLVHGDDEIFNMLFSDDDFKCERNDAGDPANEPHY